MSLKLETESKREIPHLLMSILTMYDDNPMLYVSWKLNFKRITRELGTTATEKLDLIVRWFGPASSKQANSIRACNADNPAQAVKKIWERLEERFGSPEMVERSLKERISSFPRIAGNDNKRLFDLADLVSEIAAVKEQPQESTLLPQSCHGTCKTSGSRKPVDSNVKTGALFLHFPYLSNSYMTQHEHAMTQVSV